MQRDTRNSIYLWLAALGAVSCGLIALHTDLLEIDPCSIDGDEVEWEGVVLIGAGIHLTERYFLPLKGQKPVIEGEYDSHLLAGDLYPVKFTESFTQEMADMADGSEPNGRDVFGIWHGEVGSASADCWIPSPRSDDLILEISSGSDLRIMRPSPRR